MSEQRPRLRAVGSGTAACPVCGKPADTKYRPFCSQRCSRIDLGRWLGEVYRVPDTSDPQDEADSVRKDRDDDA